MTPWKLQYQNSVVDKSDYFINNQITAASFLCSNFYKNKLVFSEFQQIPESNSATLIPKIETDLTNFDCSNNFIRSAYSFASSSEISNIFSLGSDNIIRISPARKCASGVTNIKEKSSQINILAQMQDMYA